MSSGFVGDNDSYEGERAAKVVSEAVRRASAGTGALVWKELEGPMRDLGGSLIRLGGPPRDLGGLQKELGEFQRELVGP